MRSSKTAVFFSIVCLLVVSVTKAQYKTFSPKYVDERMTKVSDSLYAGIFETTNEEYNLFLRDLNIKDTALYSQCIIDSSVILNV